MCKPYLLRFWSPFTTISAEHERMTRPRHQPSHWKPRTKRGDHVYYYVDCRDDKTVIARPLCPVNQCPSTPYSAPRNRTKDFCKDDETCRNRVKNFADQFVVCKNTFERDRGKAFVAEANRRDKVLKPWWEWCSAYEQHLHCPQRRLAEDDNDYNALVRAGIVTPGVVLPLEQRMGRDPRRFSLVFCLMAD